MKTSNLLFLLISLLLVSNCKKEEIVKGSAEHIAQVTSAISDDALVNADSQNGDWLSHGRNYQEDRYSSLDQITKENVSDLGLAWTADLGTTKGLVSSPIVIDGIMFFSGEFNQVWAYDTRTGKEIWKFDPDFDHSKNVDLCCGFSNRGLALYEGALFMGVLDGRLISIDAATGKKNWEVMTIPEDGHYSVTGAPRVVNGNVIIGNGGAEFGVRGYVTAYDAKTGEKKWRFYTVPGDPSKPFEHPDLEEAAKTWTGEWWKQGGGGTAYDAMTFDPELNLLYIGTGNGGHWDRQWRSPDGGDNLYLSSIVALNPDTGEYVWHYQTTPGDTWDYTATQPLILADMEIEGKQRKVIMQAPKNGYFYVIDRTDGSFISADNIVYQNWTTGIDKNGRPIEAEGARYDDGKVHWIAPSSHGGHNWPPMSYNHETGLVYIPTANQTEPYVHNPEYFDKGGAGAGVEVYISGANRIYQPAVVDPNAPPPGFSNGRLIAWNPKTQKEEWGIDQVSLYNGGLLSTTTGLLMQGDAEGFFSIRDVKDGSVIKQFDLRSGIVAPPVTYMVDGEQYITVLVGWGGHIAKVKKFVDRLHPGTIYTFKLSGTASFPEKLPGDPIPLTAQRTTAEPVQIGNGWNVYTRFCAHCHTMPGSGGGSVPDLARSVDGMLANYKAIVINGSLASKGMPGLEGLITEQEVEDVKAFVLWAAEAAENKMPPNEFMGNIAKMSYEADSKAGIVK